MIEPAPGLRLDKWLWHARFFKTRSLAAKTVQSGAVRLNGDRVQKPAAQIRPGDTLTFAQARSIRVVTVLALGTGRGPAPEAQTLYREIAAPDGAAKPGPRIGPRPTKKDRRAVDTVQRFPP
ncbi:MAG: RNA-binding S4 domain-containing protein [Pseudomonadota bacterium]